MILISLKNLCGCELDSAIINEEKTPVNRELIALLSTVWCTFGEVGDSITIQEIEGKN